MQKGNEKKRIETTPEGNVIVEFNSTPDNYENEISGAKSNTVRIAEATDERFAILSAGKATHVRIRNSETNDTFVRKISNLTSFYGEVIISWKHPQQPPQSAVVLTDETVKRVAAIIGQRYATIFLIPKEKRHEASITEAKALLSSLPFKSESEIREDERKKMKCITDESHCQGTPNTCQKCLEIMCKNAKKAGKSEGRKEMLEKTEFYLKEIIRTDKTPKYEYGKKDEDADNNGEMAASGERWCMPREIADSALKWLSEQKTKKEVGKE